MTPGGFHSFEHRWALPEAVEVHKGLGGRAEVARRTHTLAGQLKEGLAGIARGQAENAPRRPPLVGLVCCEVTGVDPGDVVDRLREEHNVVASVTPYRDPIRALRPERREPRRRRGRSQGHAAVARRS